MIFVKEIPRLASLCRFRRWWKKCPVSNRNHCPVCSGISVQFRPEWLSSLPRNRCPVSAGICTVLVISCGWTRAPSIVPRNWGRQNFQPCFCINWSRVMHRISSSRQTYGIFGFFADPPFSSDTTAKGGLWVIARAMTKGSAPDLPLLVSTSFWYLPMMWAMCT